MLDNWDYENIVYGSKGLSDIYKRTWIKADGTKELILGVFDPHFPDARAQYLQERVHAIGFVQERTFTENEITNNIKLYANDRFLSSEEIRKLWPLNVPST